MRIIGDIDNLDLSEIILEHKGKNLKFNCFIKPFPNALDLKEPKRIEIIFNDLMEVNSMINILTNFKKECEEYIGYWERQYD